MGKHQLYELQQMQSLPLEIKVRMTKDRITQWYEHYDGNVYVSFSGGKDSTVLLHIARQIYPNIQAVFCDTGLEYPEIREFVKGFDNVVWLKPKMTFKKVIEKYGYPLISKDVAQCLYDVSVQARRMDCDKRDTPMWNRAFNKESEYGLKYPSYSRYKYDFMNDAPFQVSHYCCDIMKKSVAKQYEKETGNKPILGTMATESRLRQTQWLQDGCNAFEVKRPTSKPLSFWKEQDVLRYVKSNNIKISRVYGDIITKDEKGNIYGESLLNGVGVLGTSGAERTGCMFCMFGCTSKNWDNLTRIKKTHPQIYEYIMKPKENGGLGYKEVIDWMNENGRLNIRY